ncbi:MAG TPA: proteasome accessory factor PafA2 family protein [Planctomycetaceae bacterium]|nr:proteasome accessory factor PafA2 family protein [Planctomycetaceae bacterium]
MSVNAEFVMSTELECLTAVPAAPESVGVAITELLGALANAAPSLPAVSGVFNAYGRVYCDCGHVELAMAECDSPYLLPLIVERQQQLVAAAVERVRNAGWPLLVAGNNHSGLLTADCPVWGSHENYMTSTHPSQFTRLVLPFLVTRIYGGAGGIQFPNGAFVAGVRPLRMDLPAGGGTTRDRAIHSTAREEHHMGLGTRRFRYHLILGDGHRSQFNLALQFGATALALKAIEHDRKLASRLEAVPELSPPDWVALLTRLNVLAAAGGPLRIDPLVVRTQRIYLEGACRYADSLRRPPAWVPRMIGDWQQTLDALERLDRGWLAARLDAFAKYELYSGMLAAEGLTWAELPRRPAFFHELALVDHSYHAFGDPGSVFTRLENAGALEHRVGERVAAGGEPEPWVPESTTRAAARARFIRDHARQNRYLVDWSLVYDRERHRHAKLEDPFAERYAEWVGYEEPAAGSGPAAASLPPLDPAADEPHLFLRLLRSLSGAR